MPDTGKIGRRHKLILHNKTLLLFKLNRQMYSYIDILRNDYGQYGCAAFFNCFKRKLHVFVIIIRDRAAVHIVHIQKINKGNTFIQLLMLIVMLKNNRQFQQLM